MESVSNKLLQDEIVSLKSRLQEAEDTLEAIRVGAVDAIVVHGETKQQIYTLKSADYMYRMLIESMNQGALTVNFDGTILYSNKQFATMLRLPLTKITGRDIMTFVAEEDQSTIKKLMQGRKTDIKVEVGLVGARRTKLTVIASATTVYYEGAKPYLCVVVTDLTERKQAEDAKDEFISLASHQLRTPATSVKQYINMVIDGLFGDLNDDQKAALLRANSSNDRELKVVDDLLRVAQIDAGKVILHSTIVDVRDLIDSVLTEQSIQTEMRQQTLIYNPPLFAVYTYVDVDLMRMVLENLIDNASKYTPAHKTITISLAVDDGQPSISIADQGVGMTKKDMSKLFQKFSRVPNELSIQVGGNGLGLYWAKKVTDLHGARIVVSSIIGKGTVFTLLLPRGEAQENGKHISG
jgi:PAS domain S-box-containing protein